MTASLPVQCLGRRDGDDGEDPPESSGLPPDRLRPYDTRG